jgi:hypothetical protein
MARLVFAVFLVVSMSACSGIKLAYNNLDRLVRWQVGEYVDLDATQKRYLQSELDTFMVWHRHNHLPLYADFILVASEKLTDNPTDSVLNQMFEQMFAWADEIEEKTMPVVVNVLVNLTDGQVAALPARLEESNREMAEDELKSDLQELQAQWAEDVEDGFERFAGRLSTAQRDYIALRATGYRPDNVLWADYRRRWQADLMALLAKRGDAENFAVGYRQLVDQRETYYGPELTEVFDHNIKLGREVAVHLLAGMTDRQSRRFAESLESLSEDLRELSQET